MSFFIRRTVRQLIRWQKVGPGISGTLLHWRVRRSPRCSGAMAPYPLLTATHPLFARSIDPRRMPCAIVA